MDKRRDPFNRLLHIHYKKVAERIDLDPTQLSKIIILQRYARRWLSRSGQLD